MRCEGWEDRLHEVLTDAASRPYVLGTHDCWLVVVAVIKALTGRDVAAKWNPYTTKLQALREMRRHGLTTLFDVGDVLVGSRIEVRFAQRGDAIAFSDGSEYHFGICTGPRVQLTLENGCGSVPLTDARNVAAWRIE